MKWSLVAWMAVAALGCATTGKSPVPVRDQAPPAVRQEAGEVKSVDGCDDACRRRRKDELERLSSLGSNRG